MRGLLWYDANPKTTLAEKVQAALNYYLKRFSHSPEVCLVNVADSQGVDLEDASKQASVTVIASKVVQPNHFWIGYEEALEVGAQR